MPLIGTKLELHYSRDATRTPSRVFHVEGEITDDEAREPYVTVYQEIPDHTAKRTFAMFVGDDSGSGWVMGYAFADLINVYHPSLREKFGEIFSAIIHAVCDPEMPCDSVYTVRNL